MYTVKNLDSSYCQIHIKSTTFGTNSTISLRKKIWVLKFSFRNIISNLRIRQLFFYIICLPLELLPVLGLLEQWRDAYTWRSPARAGSDLGCESELVWGAIVTWRPAVWMTTKLINKKLKALIVLGYFKRAENNWSHLH